MDAGGIALGTLTSAGASSKQVVGPICLLQLAWITAAAACRLWASTQLADPGYHTSSAEMEDACGTTQLRLSLRSLNTSFEQWPRQRIWRLVKDNIGCQWQVYSGPRFCETLARGRHPRPRPFVPRTVDYHRSHASVSELRQRACLLTHSPKNGMMKVGFPFLNPHAVVPAPP